MADEINSYPANVDNTAAPTNASKWRMGFNPYPANVDNMAAPTNASKWRMGFNSAFKGISKQTDRRTNEILGSGPKSREAPNCRYKDRRIKLRHGTIMAVYRLSVWYGRVFTDGYRELCVSPTSAARGLQNGRNLLP